MTDRPRGSWFLQLTADGHSLVNVLTRWYNPLQKQMGLQPSSNIKAESSFHYKTLHTDGYATVSQLLTAGCGRFGLAFITMSTTDEGSLNCWFIGVWHLLHLHGVNLKQLKKRTRLPCGLQNMVWYANNIPFAPTNSKLLFNNVILTVAEACKNIFIWKKGRK